MIDSSNQIIDYDSNWFESLPEAFKHNVFKKMDHKSLIQFAMVFPKYTNQVLYPIYWRYLDVVFKKCYFKIEEIKIILEHLSNNLKHIRFRILEFDLNDNQLEEFIKLLRNAYSINIAYNHCPDCLQTNFVKHIKYLRHIGIKWSKFDSTSLIQISDVNPNLESIYIQTEQSIDDGLINFIRKSKQITKFIVDVHSLKNEYVCSKV